MKSAGDFEKQGGWKLHLAADPEHYSAIDQWLWKNHPGSYKLLSGGEPGESDFTAYVGHKDHADDLAAKAESEIGHLLKPPASVGTDRHFGDRGLVTGRFDTNRKTNHLFYGAHGTPYDRDAAEARASAGYGGEDKTVNHLARIHKELKSKYGDYYEGTKNKHDPVAIAYRGMATGNSGSSSLKSGLSTGKSALSLLPVPGLRLADESYRYPPIGPPVVKAAKKGFPDPMAPGMETGKEEEPEGPPLPAESGAQVSRKEGAPPVTSKIHGHMGTPENDAFASGLSNSEARFVNKHALAAAAKRRQHKNTSGEVTHHSTELHHDVGGNPTDLLFTADDQGNVVAHAASDATNGRNSLFHQLSEWDEMSPAEKERFRRIGRGGSIVPILESHRRAREGAHHDAVKNGRIYAKTDVDPQVAPFLDAHAEAWNKRKAVPGLEEYGSRDWDESPQMVLADYLEERGYPLAQQVRETRLHPMALHHILSHRDEGSLSDEAKDILRFNKKPQQHSLPVQFGPALPWRTRSYHPKPRATDLREAEWEKIHRYFPEPEFGPKNRRTPVRQMLNASLFRIENLIPLRELEKVAPDCPPWGSLHSLEWRIAEAGLWDTILDQIGRSYLKDNLHKLVRSAATAAPKSGAKVNIAGLPTEAG